MQSRSNQWGTIGNVYLVTCLDPHIYIYLFSEPSEGIFIYIIYIYIYVYICNMYVSYHHQGCFHSVVNMWIHVHAACWAAHPDQQRASLARRAAHQPTASGQSPTSRSMQPLGQDDLTRKKVAHTRAYPDSLEGTGRAGRSSNARADL